MGSLATRQSRGRKARKAGRVRTRAAGTAKLPQARARTENSATRKALLDAAEHLLRKGGYSAVTSRAIAKHVGVKQQLLYYYFRTMDDVFLAVYRRYAERRIKSQAKALTSPTPLRAIWDASHDLMDGTLGVEFAALSRRQKAIRAELTRTGELLRDMQHDLVSRIYRKYGLERYIKSPEALTVLIETLARGLASEAEFGLVRGHAAMLETVEQWFETFEGAGRNKGERN